ncbi:unnamed protein product [Caenorhabditis brenneri]
MFNQDKISEDEVRKTNPVEICATFFDREGKASPNQIYPGEGYRQEDHQKGFRKALFDISQHHSMKYANGH